MRAYTGQFLSDSACQFPHNFTARSPLQSERSAHSHFLMTTRGPNQGSPSNILPKIAMCCWQGKVLSQGRYCQKIMFILRHCPNYLRLENIKRNIEPCNLLDLPNYGWSRRNSLWSLHITLSVFQVFVHFIERIGSAGDMLETYAIIMHCIHLIVD